MKIEKERFAAATLPQTSPAILKKLLRDCSMIYKAASGEEQSSRLLLILEHLEKAQTRGGGDRSPLGSEEVLEVARKLRDIVHNRDEQPDNFPVMPAVELVTQLYDYILSISPGDQTALEELAFFCLYTDQSEKAVAISDRLCKSLTAGDSRFRAHLFAFGISQVFVGDGDQAETTFRRLLAECPTAAEGYFGLALVFLKTKALASAAPFIARTKELAPELGKILAELARHPDFDYAEFSARLEKYSK